MSWTVRPPGTEQLRGLEKSIVMGKLEKALMAVFECITIEVEKHFDGNTILECLKWNLKSEKAVLDWERWNLKLLLRHKLQLGNQELGQFGHSHVDSGPIGALSYQFGYGATNFSSLRCQAVYSMTYNEQIDNVMYT